MWIPDIGGELTPFSCNQNWVTSLKLPISNHPWSALTPQKHLRVDCQRMSWP